MAEQNTRIAPCDCTSVHLIVAGSGMRTTRPRVTVPFYNVENGAKAQDAMYGKGMRVHNVGKKTMSCTVCGKEKSL